MIDQVKTVATNAGKSLVTWSWTKKLLHWMIMSAGTMAECAFLIASLWVSINANVHQFVLLFLNEQTTRHITELATTAYVALPECIVGLAVVTTLSHIRMVMYGKDYRAGIWAVLYGLPTLIFMVLSLITLGCSVANVTFQMPTSLVVLRAIAGYTFAFTSLLYTQLGEPQERDRLEEKDALLEDLRIATDDIIAKLTEQVAELERMHEEQRAEAAKAKATLIERQWREAERAKEERSMHGLALQAYSQECIAWLNGGASTVLVDAIVEKTGHSKRKITAAIQSGKLKTTSRNTSSVFVSSLIDWLKDNQPSQGKEQETGPILHAVK